MSDLLLHRIAQGESDEICLPYLETLQQLSGATAATLLIDSAGPHGADTLLAHSGELPPIPELSSWEAATAIAICEENKPEPGAPRLVCYRSALANGCLLRIAPGDFEHAVGVTAEEPTPERRSSSESLPVDTVDIVWLGLQFPGEGLPAELEQLGQPTNGAPASSAEWLSHLFVLLANIIRELNHLSRLLRDPTSHLPGRAEFQTQLKSSFHEACNSKLHLGLLLINPDEFGAINQRLDRESGDKALAEIALNLRQCLRRSDAVYRYGGAVFAVLMPGATTAAVESVAHKVREALTGAYLDGAVRLSFSVGAVVQDPDDEPETLDDELVLLRRADHALNLAKRSGGGRTVLWDKDSDSTAGGLDRLSGIFTADTEKDYRNMLLLWDTIAVISGGAQEEQIANDFVGRINMSLKPERVGLIAGKTDEDIRVLATSGGNANDDSEGFKLGEKQQQLLLRAQDAGRTERLRFTGVDTAENSETPWLAYAVPLVSGEQHLGALYLDGPEHSLSLDSSDLIFLNALASQVALALDRVYMAARWKEETERERLRLREEVQELRQVVHSARVVYRSKAMQSVFDTLHAVAPTDVTILVNGESGTGKEMLARAIHEMGNRSDKPLVTVDCGAIAQNLIEAELFGHTKGAFTGANKASEGRIVQANGGTIFLDEIGELPLDVQAKLLRFVQEKEINPVGATSSRQVDVRIVAATNRDLASEVAAGRFREDLFYRLKVVTVTSPPLRERPEDILPLAIHFLERFAVQYQKNVRRFSEDTEQLLKNYSWPGNVRELQNSILRAVVLSTSEELDASHLQFEGDSASPPPTLTVTPAPAEPLTAEITTPAAAERSSDPWASLQEGLVLQIEETLKEHGKNAVPLGKWLTEDLILLADKLEHGVSRRASARLGLAETTYRRQLEKLQQAESLGSLARTQSWARIQPAISELADSLTENKGCNAIDRARQILLREVEGRVGGNATLGARLMGVTVPTYRRWLQSEAA